MFTRWCASSAGSCSPQSGGSETKLIRCHGAHTHIHKNIFQSFTDIAQVKTAAAYFTRRLPYWSCAQRWHHPQGVDYGLKEASGGPVDGLYSDSMLQIAARRPQSPPIYSHCPAAPHASSPPPPNGFCGLKTDLSGPLCRFPYGDFLKLWGRHVKFDFVPRCLSSVGETWRRHDNQWKKMKMMLRKARR